MSWPQSLMYPLHNSPYPPSKRFSSFCFPHYMSCLLRVCSHCAHSHLRALSLPAVPTLLPFTESTSQASGLVLWQPGKRSLNGSRCPVWDSKTARKLRRKMSDPHHRGISIQALGAVSLFFTSLSYCQFAPVSRDQTLLSGFLIFSGQGYEGFPWCGKALCLDIDCSCGIWM